MIEHQSNIVMKYPSYIPFKTTKEQGEFLDTVENRSQYIREAIEEKRLRFKNAPDIEKLHFLDEEEQKQLYEILMAYCREHNIPYEYIMSGMDSESDNDKRVWRDHVNRLRNQSQK